MGFPLVEFRCHEPQIADRRHGLVDGLCHTKIAEVEVIIPKEDIIRLNISMNNVPSIDVFKGEERHAPSPGGLEKRS